MSCIDILTPMGPPWRQIDGWWRQFMKSLQRFYSVNNDVKSYRVVVPSRHESSYNIRENEGTNNAWDFFITSGVCDFSPDLYRIPDAGTFPTRVHDVAGCSTSVVVTVVVAAAAVGFSVEFFFCFLSLTLRFWNHVFICFSVRLSEYASSIRLLLVTYWHSVNSRSNSRVWWEEKQGRLRIVGSARKKKMIFISMYHFQAYNRRQNKWNVLRFLSSYKKLRGMWEVFYTALMGPTSDFSYRDWPKALSSWGNMKGNIGSQNLKGSETIYICYRKVL